MSFNILQSLIGGSPQAGGMLEAAWAVFARLMSGGAAEIFGGIARGSVGGSGAGLNLLDALTDIYIVKDSLSGSRASQGGGSHVSLDPLAQKGLKSHAFILQQLTANQHEKGVDTILKDYQARGVHLPDEDLLKRSYQRLFSIFRSDQVAEANSMTNPLAVAMGEAKAHLKNPQVVYAYNQAVESNKGAIEKLFAQITQFDWKAAYEKAERSGQLKLGFSGNMNPSYKAQQWASGLSGVQKTGLAFGAVAAIGLGAYAVAKVVDSRRIKKHENFSQRIKEQAMQGNAVGIG